MYGGCIVRHLVLPLCTNDSLELARWFFAQQSEAYFFFFFQYTPLGEANRFPELTRRLTPREYRKVENYLLNRDSERVFLQSLSSADEKYVPEWDY